MEYSKPALSISDQIAALQQRGLVINDPTQAEEFLNNVSYFRFAAYLRIFEAQKAGRRFAHMPEIHECYYDER